MNRLSGIFIVVTFAIWVLIFALSPQPKYQEINQVIIPSLPIPSEFPEDAFNIEPTPLPKSDLSVQIEDNITSAKSIIETVDFKTKLTIANFKKNRSPVGKLDRTYC